MTHEILLLALVIIAAVSVIAVVHILSSRTQEFEFKATKKGVWMKGKTSEVQATSKAN